MPLSLKEVEHIATLARLELTEEEKTRYLGQLSAILDYVAKLQKLDTADIPPTAGVLASDSHLRVDGSRPGLSPDGLLQNAPDRENNQFKIPPVFE